MQIEQLKPIIEAALLASSQPVSIAQLEALFTTEENVDHAMIAKALEALAQDCQHRGVELREVASGFRYQVRPDIHRWVARMWTEKSSRYSRALLETLALIAYRQPITRPEIEQIRGVVVSSQIIKTLEEREWIRVVGYRDVPGRPALYGTTRIFLDYFNLKSLDELPPLAEIHQLEDPLLPLSDAATPNPPPHESLPYANTASTHSTSTSFPVDGVSPTLQTANVMIHTITPLPSPVTLADADWTHQTHVSPSSITPGEPAHPTDAATGDATQDIEEHRA